MTTLSHPTQRAVVAVEPKFAVAGAVALVALLIGVFHDFFRQQVMFAITFPSDWGHLFVIPLIAGYFVYLRRNELLAEPFKTTWIGLVPIVLGIGWYMTCVLGPRPLLHANLMGAGVAATLVGLVLLFCGWRAMRWLWFPLAYLIVFGQFISDRLMQIVTFQLQDITAVGAHLGLVMLGFDADRHGNTLLVFASDGEQIPLNIATACSGMRMLMAFLALGVAMAYTGLPRAWQRVALVAMAVPTAVFVNILRVMTLGLLSMINPGLATGDFHSFIGLVWLVPAFLIYLGIMWILQHMITTREIEVDADDLEPQAAVSASAPSAGAGGRA